MSSHLPLFNFILASGSPRRAFLLEQLGIQFQVIKPDVEETYPDDLPAVEVPAYLSQKKANAITSILPDHCYITADTVVIYSDEILGKPETKQEARKMLTNLSGNNHLVVTGTSIIFNNQSHTFTTITKVLFNTLTEEIIDTYVNSGLAMDKAGGYGIQDWIGLVAVKSIEGSYTNVVGLPVDELYFELKRLEKKLSSASL